VSQAVDHSWKCVNWNVALSKEKRPDIIDSSGVIGVFVSKQNSVELCAFCSKHLLAKVGTAINDQCAVSPLDQSRRAKTHITRVIA
jgi:hypothetical protein